MSKTLTAGELVDFTGKTRNKAQKKFFEDRGIFPHIRDDGTVAVTWEAINAAQAGKSVKHETTIDYSAIQ